MKNNREIQTENIESIRRSNRRKTIALIVVASIFFAALIGWIVTLQIENKRQRTRLENMYERTFYELTDATNNLELNLSKLLVAYSREQSSALAMETYKHAEAALDAVTRLPLNRVNSSDAEKFFNQVADFCLSYNKTLAYNKDDSNYRDRLEDMYVTARVINQKVLEETENMRGGNLSVTDSLSAWDEANRSRAEGGNEGDEKDYSSVEYPELIYDGPFSDGVSQRCYKALDNLGEISLEQACGKVRELPFGISDVRQIGESTGEGAAYELVADSDAGEIYCSVTKRGGKFLNISVQRAVTDVVLNEEGAKAAAENFTRDLGFDVTPVWYNVIDGIAVINMAPVKDGITYYTDLVKVKIALDDGSLCGLETTGYCMNNCSRDLKPTMNEKAAKSVLPEYLAVNGVRLALVPDGQSELLCYEVAAEYKGLDYFIYVDAHDGRQINIMRVIDEDQGKMVM